MAVSISKQSKHGDDTLLPLPQLIKALPMSPWKGGFINVLSSRGVMVC